MTVSQKLHQICVSIENNVNGRLPWSTLFEQHLINTLKHTVLTDVIRVDKVLFKRVNYNKALNYTREVPNYTCFSVLFDLFRRDLDWRHHDL